MGKFFVKEVFGRGEQEGNHYRIAFDHPYGNAFGKKGEERAVGPQGDRSAWLSLWAAATWEDGVPAGSPS